jgi:hypothetical protein
MPASIFSGDVRRTARIIDSDSSARNLVEKTGNSRLMTILKISAKR